MILSTNATPHSRNLVGLADTELPSYKKAAYTKEFIGYKEIKQAEKGFGKATKPYAKLHASMTNAKKQYHNACSIRCVGLPFFGPWLTPPQRASNMFSVRPLYLPHTSVS